MSDAFSLPGLLPVLLENDSIFSTEKDILLGAFVLGEASLGLKLMCAGVRLFSKGKYFRPCIRCKISFEEALIFPFFVVVLAFIKLFELLRALPTKEICFTIDQ